MAGSTPGIIRLTQRPDFYQQMFLPQASIRLAGTRGVTSLPKTETSNIMSGRIVWFFYLLCSSGAALQMTGPSTYEARVGSVAHIPCTFTAHKLPVDLKYFALVWYLDGKHILSYDNTVTSTDPRYSLDKDRALNGIAHLTISNTFLSDGGIYTCSVTDSPLRQEKEIKVDISVGALQMTGPSTYKARVGSVAHIPCTFTADKLPADPKYFTVFWYLEGKHILSYHMTVTSTDTRYSLDKDRALHGIADLTILNTLLSDGGIYTCSVDYNYFLMKREISMNLSARPLLFILSKSVQRHTENTLTCMANGYFPIHINVTWYKDGEVLNNQSMGEPLQYDNGTYQVNSTATITPSDDDRNKTFSCRIQHVSLQEPLQEDFPLTYEESSSHVGTIVIAVVVIIGIITAVILWKKCKRKASDGAPPNGNDTSHTPMEEIDEQPDSDNTQSSEGANYEEQPLLNTNKASDGAPPNGNDTSHTPMEEIDEQPDSDNTQSSEGANYEEQPLLNTNKASDGAPPNGKDTSDTPMEEIDGQHDSDNIQSNKDNGVEQALLNTNKGKMPDLEAGDITVPELIAGKKATLSCRLCNYIHGEHNVSWHVKVESTGNVIAANYDQKKHQSIEKDEASDDPNTRIAYLALVPVEKYDDGSEFILKVDLPGSTVIERRTRPVCVKESNQIRGKMKKKFGDNIKEGKDQCTESPTTDQSSDQQQTCKPDNKTLKESYEEQPKSPVKVEKKDNTDTVLALVSSSSKLELDDQVKFTNLNNMEEKNLKQNPPHSPYTEENIRDSSLMGKDHKEDQSPGSQTPNQEEIFDFSLPIDISSPRLEGGDTEELTFLDNTDVKDLRQNSAIPHM